MNDLIVNIKITIVLFILSCISIWWLLHRAGAMPYQESRRFRGEEKDNQYRAKFVQANMDAAIKALKEKENQERTKFWETRQASMDDAIKALKEKGDEIAKVYETELIQNISGFHYTQVIQRIDFRGIASRVSKHDGVYFLDPAQALNAAYRNEGDAVSLIASIYQHHISQRIIRCERPENSNSRTEHSKYKSLIKMNALLASLDREEWYSLIHHID